MNDAVTRGALRDLLTRSYNDLKRRLTRRLGSADAAGDVLHETYLRLERFDGLAPVGNPQAYLLRMALNVAFDHERAQQRFLKEVEIDELWRLGDDTIDPEAIVASLSDIALFKTALSELSPRSRDILIAARVDELSHDEIARRFGISTRMVQHELRHALEYCAKRLERKVVRRFGPPAAKQS
jgi:RNA polymerase sigma-70 factor (ECF subfamily)